MAIVKMKDVKAMLGIFLDTETNGLNPKIHRMLEIAFKIYDLSTGLEEAIYHKILKQPLAIWDKSDLKSLKVNGFTFDEIQNEGKSEEEISREILEIFSKFNIHRKNSVFICQNPSFDRVFFSQIVEIELQEALELPYHWLDLASMFWSLSMIEAKKNKALFPWEIGLSKDQMAISLGLNIEEKPHRALNGVNHLIACYHKLVGFPFKK